MARRKWVPGRTCGEHRGARTVGSPPRRAPPVRPPTWLHRWDEVSATWQVLSAVLNCYRGHADRQDGIGTIHDLNVSVLGDVAYGVGTYKSTLYLPQGTIKLAVNCTDIVHLRDGVWKMIHHHADQAPPDYQAAIAGLASA